MHSKSDRGKNKKQKGHENDGFHMPNRVDKDSMRAKEEEELLETEKLRKNQ